MARLSASVPPETKTISDGAALINSAICLRAVSTAALARCPKECTDEAFPMSPEKYGNIDSITSGATSVVALLSKYTFIEAVIGLLRLVICHVARHLRLIIY